MSGFCEIVPLVPELDDEWDALVRGSHDGWLFCLSAWQHHTSSIPEWSFEQVGFGLRRNGRLLAVMPLQFTRERVLMSMAMGTGGLVISSSVDACERGHLAKVAFKRVEELAREMNAARVVIAMSPLAQSSLGNPTGVNPLVEYGYEDKSGHELILDLAADEAKIWAGLSYDARRTVKKASEAGYIVERLLWSNALDEYYRVHSETYLRTGVTPHPFKYFKGIADAIAPQKMAALWGVRAPDGRLVAFHNDARYGDTCLYWTGCCESEHLRTGVNYLLFWAAIKSAREEGYRWYGLGEVFPHVHSGKLHGLTLFKGKFGGGLRRYYKGEFMIHSTENDVIVTFPPSSLRLWMRATRDLIRPMLGTRFVDWIGRGVRAMSRRVC